MSRTPAAAEPPRAKAEAARMADDEQDEQGGSPDELAALQYALQKVIASKKDKSKQKQAQLLAEAQSEVESEAKAVKSCITKDVKELEGLCRQSFCAIEARLEEKFKEMDAMHAKYQQELNSHWEAYTKIYNEAEGSRTQCTFAIQKKTTALKRKIDQLSKSAADRLKETQDKISKFKSQTSKLPDIANILQHLI